MKSDTLKSIFVLDILNPARVNRLLHAMTAKLNCHEKNWSRRVLTTLRPTTTQGAVLRYKGPIA